ncbi:MAG: DNA polymerase III subunit delta [Clostridiales bacterium]|nr:DNA polymerase III subunit delta [Clostridiales bacterium]
MSLVNDLTNGGLKQAYLFYGEEGYLKKYYSGILIARLLQEHEKAMNFDTFEGKGYGIGPIADAFNTLPFMSSHRVILISGSGLFYQGRKADSESLLKEIDYLPETSILIFIEQQVDKRGKLYKKINSIGMAIECKVPSERELSEYIKNLFSKHGYALHNDTCAYFLHAIEHNMGNILNESKKLMDYKYNEKKIDKQDIDEICIKSLDARIFDLLKSIGNKKPQEALHIYRSMLTLKEEPIMILSMMARQFRMILQSIKLKQIGKSNAEICTELGAREFAIREYLSQSHNFSEQNLIDALKDLLDTDVKIKSGILNSIAGVELLIIKYSM